MTGLSNRIRSNPVTVDAETVVHKVALKEILLQVPYILESNPH
jgi:hypothetical protein